MDSEKSDMFNWHPNGGNTGKYGEWMSSKGDYPTCYVDFERVIPDGHDTKARDGYLVTVCKPHTYVTWDNPNIRGRLMRERVYTDTLCEACAYAENWVAEHIDTWR